MTQIGVVLFYDGVFDGVDYKGGIPTAALLSKDVSFKQLIDRAFVKRAIDRNNFNLRLFYFLQTPEGGKMRMELVDEEDVGYVMMQEHKHIYVEKEEINGRQSCLLRNVNEPAPNRDNRIPVDPDFCDEDLHVLNDAGVLDAFDNVTTNFDDDDNDDDFDDEDDDDEVTNAGNCNRNDYANVNDNGVNECGLSLDGFCGGLGENGRQMWELPGMDNFGFKEVREYALSTPYALSGLTQGSIFWSKEAMNLAVGRFALENKLSLFVLRSNKKRLEVACTEMKKGCKFAFRARKSSAESPLFHVTHFNPNCTCLCDPDRAERRTVTAKVIGSFFSSRVGDSKFNPSTIMSEVRARWAVRLWYNKAWRALQYAEKVAYGSYDESWSLLPPYLHMLKVTNPGTITAIKTSRKGNFKYSFFALGQCIDGFKNYIRPVLAMDATQLKGELKGVIFTAMGLDGSDMIYRVAFGFADKENVAGWTWFLQNLRNAIGISDDLLLITDRGKSIPPAIEEVFPDIPHANCYFHLKSNLGNLCKGRSYVLDVLWKAAYSYSKDECLTLLQSLTTICPKMHESLVNLGPNKWSRSFCPRKRWRIMTTGIAESLNKTIIPARKLPITAAHEFLRHLVQKWFCARSLSASKLESSMTEAVKDHLKEWEKAVETCQVYPIQDSVKYQVMNEGLGDGIVNVVDKSCTCNRWDMDGLPCFHAIAYARFARVSVSHLCHNYYSKENLEAAYSKPILLVPDKGVWHEAVEALRLVVLPMIKEKQAGRPKEKRIRSAGEYHRNKKCGNCGLLGHSRLTCENPPLVCGNCGLTGHYDGTCRNPQLICSKCGIVGHFRDSCPNPTLTCRKCGMTGHSDESCQIPSVPSSLGSTSAANNSDASTSNKRRRVMHCRHCGGAGHTIRTCPQLHHSSPINEPIPESFEQPGNDT